MNLNQSKLSVQNGITLIIIISISTLFSCRSSKDLIFLKDVTNNEINRGLPAEYILKTGDILYISIKSMNPEVNLLYNPESNMENSTGQGYQKYTTPSGAYLYGFEIDPEENIKLPMLGKINVSGIPISQIESVVQKKADEFLKDAIVKVKLLNFKFTVSGEVRRPGDYYNYNNSINVLEALAMANGNTDYATIKKVMVVRPVPEGRKTYMLDLSSKSAYLSEAFYLQPNDFIIVQPDKYKNFQLNSQAYSLVLSSLSVLIAVLGFVIPKL
ncbi:MAG: polysaccharide biosynthesis/export family protein [Prolixibacteraceae bacterium]|nr:polysaccharide biosynthesis/export family protein [Prolixibacteraceae bacterium]